MFYVIHTEQLLAVSELVFQVTVATQWAKTIRPLQWKKKFLEKIFTITVAKKQIILVWTSVADFQEHIDRGACTFSLPSGGQFQPWLHLEERSMHTGIILIKRQ